LLFDRLHKKQNKIKLCTRKKGIATPHFTRPYVLWECI